MVHASNPRLMNRVLDAVAQLRDGKGSTMRDVLDFLRQTSKTTPRNLTMQVHRALKHAVNAGLLRHRSGRYKVLFTLNPAPCKQSANENDDEKSVEEMNAFDEPKEPTKDTLDNGEIERGKHKKQRRRERRRKRSSSRQRKRKRHSGSRKRENSPKSIGEIRRLKHKETEEKARSPRHKISNSRLRIDIEDAPSSSNRKRSKPRSRDRTYYSDLSDSSDYEGGTAKVRKRAQVCQECKRDGGVKSSRRSASRNRSPQRQQSQQQLKNSHEDDNGNKLDSDDRRDDETEQDPEKCRDLNNSGSGSTL